MAAISGVYTLRHVAKMLGETEDAIHEASIDMFAEDGCLHIFDDAFTDDDWPLATAFTDDGIENLTVILADMRS